MWRIFALMRLYCAHYRIFALAADVVVIINLQAGSDGCWGDMVVIFIGIKRDSAPNA